MKLFRNLPARSLAARLRTERRLRLRVETERDDYRGRWIKMCEYVAVTEGKPRFSVTEPREARAPTSSLSTFADIDAENQARYRLEAEEYRSKHPEEFSQPS